MRAAGAPCARSGLFFHDSISFTETVPTRYHTPLGREGRVWEVCFHPDGPRQGARDPEREKRHYQNIYIDDIQYAAGRTITLRTDSTYPLNALKNNFLYSVFQFFLEYLLYICAIYLSLKSTSVKRGCTKSKKTPKFGAGAIC